MTARKTELMKILSEAQAEAEMLAKLAPGTEDYRKHENKVTELKARHEAGREQAEREFTQRQAEMMATLYKEVSTMVARVAKLRHMNYVLKISNQPISGANPNSVMAAVSSTIVYADPANDITKDVIHNLNNFYQRSLGASTTKGASATWPRAARARQSRLVRGVDPAALGLPISSPCGAELIPFGLAPANPAFRRVPPLLARTGIEKRNEFRSTPLIR